MCTVSLLKILTCMQVEPDHPSELQCGGGGGGGGGGVFAAILQPFAPV